MAYRRKPGGNLRPLVLEDDPPRSAPEELSSDSSLAARAIRASSAARRESSLYSAYGESALSSPPPPSAASASYMESPGRAMRSPSTQDSNSHEYTSMKSLHEPKYGFWGVLADKAKKFLEEEKEVFRQQENVNRNQASTRHISTDEQQLPRSNFSSDNNPKNGGPKMKKGLDAISSSINYIGGKVGNALEETRKLNIRRKGSASNLPNRAGDASDLCNTHNQMDLEIQVKAARDVANAMAAKAKLLMRELKTVKADLAFAKERCAQLEEENKILRESNERGDNAEDDDLIRLQLETLLAEKARLSQENSVYARENRFLREIVEYHRLTMQDVVYLDEGAEEVTEVYTVPSPTMSPHGSVCGSPTTTQASWSRTFSAPATMPSSRHFSSQTSISKGASPVCPIAPQSFLSDDHLSNADEFPL